MGKTIQRRCGKGILNQPTSVECIFKYLPYHTGENAVMVQFPVFREMKQNSLEISEKKPTLRIIAFVSSYY